jgi:hypothetical protein
VTNRVEIRTRLRPDRLRVRAWRRVEDGQPRGAAEILEAQLRPRRRDGSIVAWVAKFQAEVKRRRYIEVEAKWRRPDCKDFDTYAWTFALDRT